MSRIILQGELKPLGLLNLVQLLCSAQLTGALRIYEFGLTFTIYLDQGYMVSASAPDQEPLGEKLLRKRRITPEQLDRALELQHLARRRGKSLPIGRILVHQQMVSEKDLEECVFDQIIETICLSLELPHPYFSFARLDIIHPAKFRAFINFQFALLEAFRIADEIRASDDFDPERGPAADPSTYRDRSEVDKAETWKA
ncbi:MAG: hypothetical protein Kow00129_15150 [Thermoleophilia bacterium]